MPKFRLREQIPSQIVFWIFGSTMTDTRARIPEGKTRTSLAQSLWVQDAFENSMIHGELRFTLDITFHCVLHRNGSLGIHCKGCIRASRCPHVAVDKRDTRTILCRLTYRDLCLQKIVRPYILMIPPQVHLRRPCYDFSFLQTRRFS